MAEHPNESGLQLQACWALRFTLLKCLFFEPWRQRPSHVQLETKTITRHVRDKDHHTSSDLRVRGFPYAKPLTCVYLIPKQKH